MRAMRGLEEYISEKSTIHEMRAHRCDEDGTQAFGPMPYCWWRWALRYHDPVAVIACYNQDKDR